MILDELKTKAEEALHSLSKKLKLTRRIQILEAIRSRRNTIHRESIVVASQELDDEKSSKEKDIFMSDNVSSNPPQWAIDLQKSVNLLRKEMKSLRARRSNSTKEEEEDEIDNPVEI